MKISVRHIQEVVAEHFEVAPAAMRQLPRNAYAPENAPRQVAMFFARRVTRKSYKNIANMFGRKDHTTVMYAEHKVERMIAQNDSFAADINAIERAIGS